MQGDSRYIKGHCLPYDDDLTLRDVERLVDELADAGRVVRYDYDGDPFLHLPRLHKHQRLDPRVPSRLPEPPPQTSAQHPDESERAALPSEYDTDESGLHTDSSAPRADSCGELDAKQVAGSRGQGAGSREQDSAPHAAPQLALVPVAVEEQEPPSAPAVAPAQQIVAAYVEGAQSAGLPPPAGSLPGRVGRQAKGLLDAHPLPVLLDAARAMGAAGWHDLAVQVQRTAVEQRPTTPRRPEDGILQRAMQRAQQQEQ